MEKAAVIIIGGGVVGLAISSELTKRHQGVYVFEKNKRIGQEVSSHNSGVIHSGIHYPRDSLKSQLCIKGNPMIYELCERYGISHKKLGKITVANGESGIRELEKLMKTGEEKNVPNLRLIDGNEVRKMEPNVRVDRGLYTPTSGIIEPDELINYFYAITTNNRGVVATETEVTSIRQTDSGYIVEGRSVGNEFSIQAETVINSAGLNSDRIAQMVGLDIDRLGYRLSYCKGDYYRVSGKPLVRMLVYPLPKGSGLGIHLTPDLAGVIRLGPNAYFVDEIDYRVGSGEKEFREDVSKYVPLISDRRIDIDSSGIRPKLKGPIDSFKDFKIKHESENNLFGFINLIGIESPGLTASPAIAESVLEMYENEIIR